MANNSFQEMLMYIKYTYSSVLLGFCIVLVMACIVTGQSKAAMYNIHPALAVIVFWILIGWLAIMEGGQGCLVGLKPIDKDKYRNTHRVSLKCCNIAHKGVNLERFIIGRQFLVVLVIFLLNMMGEAVPGADPLGLPSLVNYIFLGNSLAMILTVIDIGQLPAQVTAATAMLDFIQSYIFLMTTYISLAIEFSGLLHSVYIVQYAFEAMAGTNKNENENEKDDDELNDEELEALEGLARANDENNGNQEPEKGFFEKVFFWGRVFMSTCILMFALAVTISALIEGKSGMWDGVPIWASIIIFFVLLCVVGLMEGMQIAAFALLNMPEEELKKHKIAHKTCTLMFAGENLQSFLIGRQIFVAALMFIVAKVATISIEPGETNIFNVPDGFQLFLDTGLLGAVILTIIGSLAWRVIASSLPLLFMSNPILYLIIRACFLLEAIGICAVAWLLAILLKTVCRHKTDDEYLGTKSIESATEMDADEQKINTPRTQDEDEDYDMQGSRPVDKAPREKKSMREILSGDSMKSALVQAARYSAVVSTRDIDKLMADLHGMAAGKNRLRLDVHVIGDSDDEVDLPQDKKKSNEETPAEKKSLRDFSNYLTTQKPRHNDDEDVDETNPNAVRSMKDIIAHIFGSKKRPTRPSVRGDPKGKYDNDDVRVRKNDDKTRRPSKNAKDKKKSNHDDSDDSDDNDQLQGKVKQMKKALVQAAVAARDIDAAVMAQQQDSDDDDNVVNSDDDDRNDDSPENTFRDIESSMEKSLRDIMNAIRGETDSSKRKEPRGSIIY